MPYLWHFPRSKFLLYWVVSQTLLPETLPATKKFAGFFLRIWFILVEWLVVRDEWNLRNLLKRGLDGREKKIQSRSATPAQLASRRLSNRSRTRGRKPNYALKPARINDLWYLWNPHTRTDTRKYFSHLTSKLLFHYANHIVTGFPSGRPSVGGSTFCRRNKGFRYAYIRCPPPAIWSWFRVYISTLWSRLFFSRP